MVGGRFCQILSLILAVAAGFAVPVGPAYSADHTVGVVAFYTPTSLDTVSGMTPEEYASDALTQRLAAASSGRLVVLPRGRVRAEERRLRWSGADDLRFTRLVELGRGAGADRLVVGWVRLLDIDSTGGGGTDVNPEGNSGGLLTCHVIFVLQVFDVAQGRIVYQTTVDGHAASGPRPMLVERAVNDALTRGVPGLIAALSGAAARWR